MKKFLVAVATLVLAVTLAACSGTDKYEVDVFIYNYADTYIGGVRTELAEILKEEKTLKVNFHNADLKQDEQNSQIDGAIAKGTDLLVVNIVEPQSADVIVAKAKAADIPVLFFNREISDASLNSYGNDMSAFIGTDPDEAGVIQGELAADIILADYAKADRNKDGKIGYAMIRAELTNPEANGRTKYSVETANAKLEKAGKDPLVQFGVDLVADWDTAKAKDAMAGLITSHGIESFDIIFANNDDMALGIIQALQDAGYNKEDKSKFIPVLGVDATATAVDAINRGELAGTVKQDGSAMAAAIKVFIMNKSLDKDFNAGSDYKYEEGSKKVRIPYSKVTAQ